MKPKIMFWIHLIIAFVIGIIFKYTFDAGAGFVYIIVILTYLFIQDYYRSCWRSV